MPDFWYLEELLAQEGATNDISFLSPTSRKDNNTKKILRRGSAGSSSHRHRRTSLKKSSSSGSLGNAADENLTPDGGSSRSRRRHLKKNGSTRRSMGSVHDNIPSPGLLDKSRCCSSRGSSRRSLFSESTDTTSAMSSIPSLSVESLPEVKTVSFDREDPTIHFMEDDKSELSNSEEFNGKWLSRSDFNLSKAKTRALIAKHAKQQQEEGKWDDNNDDNDCLRGLEHRLKGYNRMRRSAIKRNSINAVMAEQARSDHTPDSIRKIYREYNQPNVHEAIELGLKDQRDVLHNRLVDDNATGAVPPKINVSQLDRIALECSMHRRASLQNQFINKDHDDIDNADDNNDEASLNGMTLHSFNNNEFGEDFLDDFHDSMILVGH